MKSILLFQRFNIKDEMRRRELASCIEHNLDVGFDEVIIFNDSTETAITGPRVRNVYTDKRLTFRDFIEVMRSEISGYGRGKRFVNKGYRDNFKRLLTDEERAFAMARFGPELQKYFSVGV